MKHVLVTGAGGYIGRGLVARLRERLAAGALQSLTLVDLRLDADLVAGAEGVRGIEGDLGDADVLARATAAPPDAVFHLAGITSRRAEDDPALGLRVNVQATMALFERLREQGRCPVLVYASSIGVHGPPLPAAIDDDTPPAPALSYGAHKRMIEILLADHSRRGAIDGRAVRLPGIVARPTQPGAALSAFAGELMRAGAEGRRITCPVGPDAAVWLLSLPACIEHLLIAAEAPAAALPTSRAWHLPALRVRIGELVEALGRRHGREVEQGVDYAPQPALQAQFAQWPPLSAGVAQRLGMRDDGDLDTLITRALARAPFAFPTPR